MRDPGPRSLRVPLEPDVLHRRLAAALGERAGRVEVAAACPSTSSALAEALRAEPERWPDRSVLVADHQSAGRGRAGRTWTTPPHVAATFSLALRPRVPAARLGWVPLLGGLAVVRAVRELTGVRAMLKWPNDVLLPAADELAGWGRFRKVAGVLGDVVPVPAGGPGDAPPDGGVRARPGVAVVLGIGVNVAQSMHELPVESATSLALAGAPVDRADVLVAVLAHWSRLDATWRGAAGDAELCGLAEECSDVCVTLGSPVEVDLPDGDVLEGTAVELGADGALVVDGGGAHTVVRAGDVRLRVRGGQGGSRGPGASVR